MTEKILSEIRFIETDDGFRVEMKGDKEQLKKMGFMHKGPCGRGFFGRGRGRSWSGGHGYGPPPWAWEWEETSGEDAPSSEKEA